VYSRLAWFGTANEPLNQTVYTVRVGVGDPTLVCTAAVHYVGVYSTGVGPVGNIVDTSTSWGMVNVRVEKPFEMR
jgi:hypothetical protein